MSEDMIKKMEELIERAKQFTKQSEFDTLADHYSVLNVDVTEGVLEMRHHGKGNVHYYVPLLISSVPNKCQTWGFKRIERCGFVYEVREAWSRNGITARTHACSTVHVEIGILTGDDEVDAHPVRLDEYLFKNKGRRPDAAEVVDAIGMCRDNFYLRKEIEEAKKKMADNEKLLEDARMSRWVDENEKLIVTSYDVEGLISCSEEQHYYLA